MQSESFVFLSVAKRRIEKIFGGFHGFQLRSARRNNGASVNGALRFMAQFLKSILNKKNRPANQNESDEKHIAPSVKLFHIHRRAIVHKTFKRVIALTQ